MQTGWAAGLRAYQNPEGDVAGAFDMRLDAYRYLWSLYENRLFERDLWAVWSRYLTQYRLYPFTKSLYNPTHRLVDSYAGFVYPGLATATRTPPAGIPVATPFDADTSDELRAAIDQLFQWSNWQSAKDRMVRTGAALGDVAVEVVDDLERERVYWVVHWPGRIYDLDRDERGNVKLVDIRYSVEEREAGTDRPVRYQYRKLMTADGITEYRDDTIVRAEANPYPFVPMVWIQHRDVGAEHGAPAIDGVTAKIDHLNSLVSRLHQQIATLVDSPYGIATDSKLTPALSDDARHMLEEGEISMRLLMGKSGTSSFPLAGNLNLGDALPYAQELLKEIEHDLPELGMYAELRSMSALTGPAAARLLGDVQSRVLSAAANYDQATIQLIQMGTAIGGWRLSNGWTMRDKQREAFAGFDLDSYGAGDLDVQLEPRPLVPVLETERWQAEMSRAQALGAYVTAGIPVEVAMPLLDFSPDEIAEISANTVAAIDRGQRIAVADVPPTGQLPPAQ